MVGPLSQVMKVLFAWELGAGMGHLSPHEPLLRHLCQLGHEVVVVAQNVVKARRAFRDLSLVTLQCPMNLEKPDPVYRPTPSMAHVLHNSGFSRAESLKARIQSWQELLELIRPDLVVGDYYPTLQLALLDREIGQVVLGNGFTLPPAIKPLPDFSVFQGRKFPKFPQGEEQTLGVINQALQSLRLPLLTSLSELWHKRGLCLLKTLEELDHYGDRNDGIYLGVPPSPRGKKPHWPTRGERRIFAYLKPDQLVGDLLAGLQRTNCQVIIAGDGLSSSLENQFSSPSLRFEREAVDLYETLESADLVVNNANHGSSAHSLLEGVPLVMVPQQLEQRLFSSRLQSQGLALEMTGTSEKYLDSLLNKGLESAELRQNVHSFQQKYRDFKFADYQKRLLEQIASVAAL